MKWKNKCGADGLNAWTKVGMLLAAVCLIAGLCHAEEGKIFPIAGAPDLEKLDWKASDEYCRVEMRNGRKFLVIDVPQGKEKGSHWFRAAFDPAPLRGKNVTFLFRYRTQNVSTPLKKYYGSKFMVSYRDASSGEKLWPDAGLLEGNVSWCDGALQVTFRPGAADAEVMLGLQEVSGRIEFEFDSLRSGSVFSPAARINLDYKVKYPQKTEKHSRLRGMMSPAGPMTEEMFRTLKQWNVNLVRMQIMRNWNKLNTELDLDEYYRWLDKRLDEIENATRLAEKYGIRLIIDLHSPPGGKSSLNHMRMFCEKKYADAFLDCWRRIAARFKGNPAIYAYNLLNEPVQAVPAPYDYWNLQRMAAAAVREIDPDTAIMIESNEASRPRAFAYLSPLRMDNIIYQVHMYMPLTYTHQRIRTAGPPIGYPGMIDGEMWNKEKIRETLQPVRDFQLRHNARIYVGEFSAVAWAPGADRYLQDCIDIFEEYGWEWSYHAFREWNGWSVEHEGTGPDNIRPAKNTRRREVLLKAFRKNNK